MDIEQNVARQAMEEVLDFPVFTIHERVARWRDVLASAAFLGQLRSLLEQLVASESALARAQDEGISLDPQAAQQVANDLRYHHNLITAEETAEWLADRHLSLEDLNAFVAANLLQAQLDVSADAALAELPANPAELARQLWCQAILRDLWPDLLPPLARRLLVEELRLNEQTFDSIYLDRARQSYSQRHRLPTGADPAAHAAGYPFIGDDWEVWLKREAIYLQYCARIADEPTCQRRLAAMRPELYHVDYEVAHFELHDVVREAYLCATVDHESLRDICERAPGSYQLCHDVIEDVDEDLKSYLISARTGEIQQPFAATDGGYYLLNLRQKTEPRLADPEIRQRVRRHLIDEAFSPYLEQHIGWPRWQFNLPN